MKSNKEEILKLYFESKLKQVEIAEKLNISKNAVSKTLKLDERYEQEKNNRKQQNKIKHNKQIQNIVEAKRKVVQTNNGIDRYVLKAMHEQDVRVISGGRKPMNNRAFRDWNSSIYKHSKDGKSYVLKKGITAGYDVPKKIRWI